MAVVGKHCSVQTIQSEAWRVARAQAPVVVEEELHLDRNFVATYACFSMGDPARVCMKRSALPSASSTAFAA